MAILLWLMFESWSRVGEALRLTARSVIPAYRPQSPSELHGDTTTRVAIILNNSLYETPGKTGDFDHVVPLDLERHCRLSTVLLHLVESAAPLSLLFPFTYQGVRAHFLAAEKALGLTPIHPSVHSLRHGGASHDAACHVRTLPQIQQRGNWRSISNVKRYEKSSLLGREWLKLPPSTRQTLEENGSLLLNSSEESFEELFRLPRGLCTKSLSTFSLASPK